MKIINDYQNLPNEAKGSVIAIGNFDGVHKGHVAVIEKAKKIAAREGLKTSVLTFAPHPLTILKPDIKPFRLTTDAQKAALIGMLGIDFLFAIKFDKEFSQIKANEFVKKILVDALVAKHVITGEDFIFGHNREGSPALLFHEAEHYNFGYSKVVPVGNGADVFSSSAIRNNLSNGRLHEAKAILGRNFVIDAVVIEGNKQGRNIGFPTINLALSEYIRPAFGVYAVKIYIDGRAGFLRGAANIGIRPTINGTNELLEVHIFDFSENIYGQKVAVELIEYIRPERKFSNMDALKEQIKEDCIKIRELGSMV